jgi:hypothetical protein
LLASETKGRAGCEIAANKFGPRPIQRRIWATKRVDLILQKWGFELGTWTRDLREACKGTDRMVYGSNMSTAGCLVL